jgi:hypothetical protein
MVVRIALINFFVNPVVLHKEVLQAQAPILVRGGYYSEVNPDVLHKEVLQRQAHILVSGGTDSEVNLLIKRK